VAWLCTVVFCDVCLPTKYFQGWTSFRVDSMLTTGVVRCDRVRGKGLDGGHRVAW
jgi:hypothetical protein